MRSAAGIQWGGTVMEMGVQVPGRPEMEHCRMTMETPAARVYVMDDICRALLPEQRAQLERQLAQMLWQTLIRRDFGKENERLEKADT